MLGSMIQKIRKEKHITKASLARNTGMNIGHLTHIEKSERNPSHKALKSIAKNIDVSYQLLSSLYDIELTDEYKRCKMQNHLSCEKVLAIDSFSNFIDCPKDISNASVAIKIQDDVMEPTLTKGTYGFLQLNVPLNNKEIGLFEYENQLMIRRFIIRKDKLVLRADNKNYKDIDISEDSNFTIIGKIFISKKD